MNLLKSKISPLFKGVKKKLTSFFGFLKIKRKNDVRANRSDLDKKMVYSLSKTRIPSFRQIKYVSKFLTRKEVWIIRGLFLFIFLNISFLGFNFYKNHLIEIPVRGGSYSEALVGSINHINPLYASVNDVDSDISSLIFSSLFKYNGKGELVGDLVKEYSISEDGKEYNITLKDNVLWHSDAELARKELNADDVIFTFKAIKNPAYESPIRASFSGVNLEKIDDYNIKFILSEKYAPFLSLLTFGILPSELWSNISPEGSKLAPLNLKPIGSGPYKFKTLVKNNAGSIKVYNLVLNNDYYGGGQYIKNITFKFFVNFSEAINALNNNLVNGVSYLPYENKDDVIAKDSLNFFKLALPQMNSIFFNRDTLNTDLKSLDVRKALAFATPKQEIITDVLGGDAQLVSGPILTNNFAFKEAEEKYDFNLGKAKEILDQANWKEVEISADEIVRIEKKLVDFIASSTASSTEEEKEALTDEENIKLSLGEGKWRINNSKDNKEKNNYLIVNLTVVNEPRDIGVVQKIKEVWEKVGVKTNINIVETNLVQSEILDARKFEALFFRQALGTDPDSYAFWHSTQTGKGGLNIASYRNDEVDTMLEEARVILKNEERKEKYGKFQDLIAKDVPVIFLYSPIYTYIQSKNINGFDVEGISKPADRFANIGSWYVKKGKRLSW